MKTTIVIALSAAALIAAAPAVFAQGVPGKTPVCSKNARAPPSTLRGIRCKPSARRTSIRELSVTRLATRQTGKPRCPDKLVAAAVAEGAACEPPAARSGGIHAKSGAASSWMLTPNGALPGLAAAAPWHAIQRGSDCTTARMGCPPRLTSPIGTSHRFGAMRSSVAIGA